MNKPGSSQNKPQREGLSLPIQPDLSLPNTRDFNHYAADKSHTNRSLDYNTQNSRDTPKQTIQSSSNQSFENPNKLKSENLILKTSPCSLEGNVDTGKLKIENTMLEDCLKPLG